ncbi:histidine kinase [Halosquirtibacter xylanolyticus]|uniref:sensor histidine kinase n=1 Tax=Halosquirtibacter xylanolyticus TaxID=3374599 RepID=UPI003747B032|nr:histidine kinase [Prolixibacteraceae bacterium]
MNSQKLITSFKDGQYNKPIRYIFHTLYILGFLFIFIPSYGSPWPIELPRFFFRDVFEYSLISCFVYILYIIKNSVTQQKRNTSLSISIITMVGVLITLAYFKNHHHYYNTTSYYNPSYSDIIEDFMQYIGFGTLLFSSFILIDNINILFKGRYYKMKEALEEATNQLLRQQFHPHFMFNALNSIYSMALNSHTETPEAILKLSAMMRYLTDEITVRRIPISREVKFLKDYISIEKIRFGEEANIKITEEGDLNNKFIEPLLLIPLVENAFKHGFYNNNMDSYVHMSISIKGDIFTFTIENSIIRNRNKIEEREGKGIKNLNERLDLSYPNKYDLTLLNKETSYLATLQITITT